MKKARIQFALPVSILRENDSFIAYTPALDLSTVGDTFEEAKKRFEEAVQLFFEEIMEEGKMDQALTELGWRKQENIYSPPVVVSHMTENFSIPFSS